MARIHSRKKSRRRVSRKRVSRRRVSRRRVSRKRVSRKRVSRKKHTSRRNNIRKRMHYRMDRMDDRKATISYLRQIGDMDLYRDPEPWQTKAIEDYKEKIKEKRKKHNWGTLSGGVPGLREWWKIKEEAAVMPSSRTEDILTNRAHTIQQMRSGPGPLGGKITHAEWTETMS